MTISNTGKTAMIISLFSALLMSLMLIHFDAVFFLNNKKIVYNKIKLLENSQHICTSGYLIMEDGGLDYIGELFLEIASSVSFKLICCWSAIYSIL